MTNQLYIANLGKYNEGILQGEWFSFPIDMKEVTETIGLNAQYEEWAIHDYEFDFPLTISEYADIEKLNELVETIEEDTELVELLEIMKIEKYNTDAIAGLAMTVFNNLEIDHDIIDDEQLEEMVKSRLESGGYVGVKCFLHDASNTNEYHILDGYENVDRLTSEYIENVLGEYISNLVNEYGF